MGFPCIAETPLPLLVRQAGLALVDLGEQLVFQAGSGSSAAGRANDLGVVCRVHRQRADAASKRKLWVGEQRKAPLLAWAPVPSSRKLESAERGEDNFAVCPNLNLN